MSLTETKIKKGSIKRVLTLTMCAITAISCCAITASAATKSVSLNANVFTESWEKTQTWNSGSVKLKYGFDTFNTDEDYCKSYNSNVKHTATVEVAKTKDSATGKMEKWSPKAEVKHKSGTVIWSTSY